VLDDRRLTANVDRAQEPPARRLEDPHGAVLASLRETPPVRAVRDLWPPPGEWLLADARHPDLQRRVIERAAEREDSLRRRRSPPRRHPERDRAFRTDRQLRLAERGQSARLLGPCRLLRVLAQHECADPSRDRSGEQDSDGCQLDPQPTELAPALGAAG